MKIKNKIDKKIKHYPRFLLCTVKTIDSHFVQIPTLHRDDSGIEPCQVGIPTLPDKARILELSGFLLCAEHVYAASRNIFMPCSEMGAFPWGPGFFYCIE